MNGASRHVSTALGAAARGFDAASSLAGDAARTARFLRGRLETESRDSDIFVVSYPRSGTSWLQMILHHLLTDGRLDFDHISQVQPWYERSLALGTRTAAQLNELPEPRVFKSHLVPGWLPKAGRFVYVVRDVADVVVSYYHFYRSHLGFRDSLERFFERFLAGDVQYRSWFSHVARWMNHADEPNVHVVRFESLLSDPMPTIRTIADFVGGDTSDDHIESVRRKTSFDAMKAIESKVDPITEHLIDRGHLSRQFLRSGTSGGGASLTHEQRARLSAALVRHQPQRELRLAAFLH